MFRRKNRSQSSVSRNFQRYSRKVTQRATKADNRWLRLQSERQHRLQRFQRAWRRSFSFIPMVRSGLSVMWATMLSAFQQFFIPPTRPIRGAVNRNGVLRWGKSKGRKASRTRSGQKSDTSGKTYELMEDRKLLAADIMNLDLVSTIANDTGASQTDNITMSMTADYTVDYSNAFEGETIEIRDNSTNVLYGSFAIPVTTSFGTPVVPGSATISATLPDDATTEIRAQSGFGSGVTSLLDVTIDTTAPTVISQSFDTSLINDDFVSSSGGTTTLSFTFDEDMDTVAGGSTTIAGLGGGTFISPATSFGFSDSITYELDLSIVDVNVEFSDVLVDQGSGTVPRDVAGNPLVPVTGLSTGTEIDTLNPGVTLGSTLTSFNLASATDTITITLTEAPASGTLTASDLDTSSGGTITALSGSGTTWTATYTAPAGFQGTETVSVAAAAFTDVNDNDNTASNVLTFAVDTVSPAVMITSDQGTLGDTLYDSETPALLTFTFSEDTATFTLGDISITAGSLANFTMVSASEYTVEYTPPAGVEGIETVSVATGAFSDLAGNPSTALATVDLLIDTKIEKVSIDPNDDDPQEDSGINVNAAVTFEIDEASVGVTTISYDVIGGTAIGEATASVDFDVPDATSLVGQVYSGTIDIAAGTTSVTLDIDVLPDLILEGDETFEVVVTAVSNTVEDVMVDATADTRTVIIEDDEVGAEVTLTVADMHAAEGAFNFPAVDLSGASLLGDDIIANNSPVDSTQTVFDATKVFPIYQTDGAFGSNNGLPDSGVFPATPGVHPEVQLSYNDADNGPNARLTPAGTVDVFNIDVFNNEYEAIHIFGAAADGSAAVSVRFFYDDAGTVGAQPSKSYGDWTSAATGDVYALFSGADRATITGSTSTNTDDSSIWGGVFTPDPNRVLDYVEVSVNTTDADNGGDGGTFAFFGASGVAKGNNMGVYTLNLDTELTSDYDVTLETSGVAVNGVDYTLAVESVPGSGTFDLALPGTSTVDVTIPAGETSIDIKLTAIDDMIIEGGLTNSPGFEDAILTIDSDSGPQAGVVDIGTQDTGSVKIEDNDFGTVRIVATDPDAAEAGEDPGEFKVILEKAGIATGMTTSSVDTEITLSITGEAINGVDYDSIPNTVTIPANTSMTTITISPEDDDIVEGGKVDNPGSEDVNLTLTGFAQNDPDISILGGGTESGAVEILDNDSAFVNVTVWNSEGVANGPADENPLPSPPDDDTVDGVFRFTLDNESSSDTLIKFTILGFNTAANVEQTTGVSTDATYGLDYTLTSTNGTLSFNPGTGMGTISIPDGDTTVDLIVDVTNEDIIEDNETVRIEAEIVMADPNVTIDGLEHEVTINDEDQSDVAINGTAFALEGGQDGEFTVSLDAPNVSDSDTLIEFMVMPASTLPAADLPGTPDFDYTVPVAGDVVSFNPVTGMGVVSINAFSPDAKIVVVANDDALIEDTEFAKVKILGVVGGDSNINEDDGLFTEAEIEIRDNDSAFVKISRISDGAEPSTNGLFRVDLVDAFGSPVTTSVAITVNYTVLSSSTASGAAFNNGVNADYEALSGSVVVNPGDSGADIVVNVFNDFILPTNESDETVDVRLDGTDNTDVDVHAMDEASVTITDDDGIVVSIVASDSMAREGNDDGEYTLLLSGASDSPVVVDLGVLLGNGPNVDATDGSDYGLSQTQITFAPFQTSATVDLNVINDAVLEEFIEQAEVEVDSIVSSNTGVSIDPTSAIVDIKPDPTVQVQAFDNMGMEGADDASFIVHLPLVQDPGFVSDLSSPLGFEIGLADGDLTIEYEVRGDADNGLDYALLSGTVTIPASDGYAFINVDITDDMIVEDLENVVVVIKSVTADDVNDSDIDVRKDLYSIDRDAPVLRIVNTDVSDMVADGQTDREVEITLADGRSVNGGVGLAVDPTTWTMYGILKLDGGVRELATIDPATGIATSVGELSDNFAEIAFDSSGQLYGVTGDGAIVPQTLYTIDKSDASETLVTSLAGGPGGDGEAIAFNPLSSLLHYVDGEADQWSTVGLSGTPIVDLDVFGGFDDVTGLTHAEFGNFAGDFFFVVDLDDQLYRVDIVPDGTGPDDAVVTFVGAMQDQFGDDYQGAGLAFFKSTDFVQIKDNDTAFVEVTAKAKGDDSTNSDTDTGFNITLRKPDGTTATTSDTDTTVSFTIDNTATPYLGAQTSDGGNIDTYPGPGFGGALNWGPFGPGGLPMTTVNGEYVSSGGNSYTFTVLNDGDFVSVAIDDGTVELFDGAVSLGAAGSNFVGALDAGVYTILVDGLASDGDPFSMDVIVENHLIADYQLTSAAGNNLTSLGGGEWEVTIPAGEETIMVVVDVWNDTQVEGEEEVSLWLGSVVDGDADVHTGLVYFADDTTAGGFDPDAGIGRVDTGGGNLIKLIGNTGPGNSDPYGVSIDHAEGKVYWTDQDPGRQGIYRANLDGSDVENILLIAGVGTSVEPRGLEVAGDYVYWVDESTEELHRILKDGSGTIEDLLDLPAGSDLDDVAIDSVNSKIYFVDDGPVPNDTISRADLDGTNIETVIQFSNAFPGSPQAIALDVASGKMYWTDSATDTIRRADLNGTNIETVSSTASASPDGIALDLINRFVYWNDSAGTDNVMRAPMDGGTPEVVANVEGLDGAQDLRHLDLWIPTQQHATAVICDHDEAVVFVSTDNTRAEAEVDPASEPGVAASDHKEIIVSLRDANGNPVTAQDPVLLSYLYDALSTATNGQDHVPLSGSTSIPAGVSNVPLSSLPGPSIFVLNDSQLEGDEDVVIKLDSTSGDPDVSVIAPNANNEDTAWVVIEDDETADVIVEAVDDIAKERDGIIIDGAGEELDPGVFRFTQSESSTSDTVVTFMLDTPTDAEDTDYFLSAPAGNNLTLVSPGVWEVTILANETEVEVTVNVVEDELIELDETVAIKITGVTSATNAAVSVGGADAAMLTIFDDDIGKVIITNVGDAVESTQPGVSPGTSGQFKIALVNPITGDPVESETATQVRVILNEAIPDSATFSATTGTNDGDYTIVEIVTPVDYPTSPRYAIIDFNPGDNMVFLDVDLIEETPALDMGNEFVKLSLDHSYGVVGDGRVDDGVVGDAHILLDQTPAGVVVGSDPNFVFAVDVSGSVFGAELAAEKAALIALNNKLILDGFGATAEVSVVPFGTTSSILDMEPGTPGLQQSTSPETDSNNNGINDVEEVINSLSASGGTNFEQALQNAISILTPADPANGNVIFVSDGSPTSGGSYADEVAILSGLADNIRAFGIGSGATLGPLQVIDPAAVLVLSPGDLVSAVTIGTGTDSGGGGGELVYTFDHPDCPDIVLDGMGMDMATVTIIDEQFKINIEANDENASEPGTNAGDNGQFTISISNPWQFGDTIVNFSVSGTADFIALGGNPADFMLSSGAANNLVFDIGTGNGQITIPAGQSAALLDVVVVNDELIEFDSETVVVTLTGLDDESTGAVENDPMVGVRMLGSLTDATVNIFDDDSAVVTPSTSDATANEPTEGVSSKASDNGQFTLSLLEAGLPVTSSTDTVVKFTMSGDAKIDNSAAAGDYTGFDYHLSAPSAYALTHIGGGMYEITIPAKTSSVTIDVVTLDDYVLEDDETAILTVNAVVSGDAGISVSGTTSLTITDTDEGELKLVELDNVGEEDGGLNPDASFVVRLVSKADNSQRLASDTDTDVTFAVDASSTATLGSDFDFGTLSTMVTIDAFTGMVPDFSLGGDGEAVIPVDVLFDTEIEDTETVVVNATAVSGDADIELHSMASMIQGTASILDNDSGTVSLVVTDGIAGEPGDDGQFQVVLSDISSTPTVVTYAIVPGSTDADYGDDFTLNGESGPFTTATVTIGAGDLTADIDLEVIDNLTQESDEDVTIRIIGVSGDPQVSIDTGNDEQTITITDEDVPTFTVVNTMANENAGTIDFTVELSQPIDVDVDVFLALTDFTAEGAAGPLDFLTSDQDYLSGFTSIVTFGANGVGGLTQVISVPINDDIWVEADEVFTAQLIVDGASLPNQLADGREINILDDQDGTSYGQGLIKNNDTATFFITGIDVDDPTVIEGTNSTPYEDGSIWTNVNFLVEVSNPIDVDVDVEVDFTDGSATGAVFSDFFSSLDLPFGTDYDSETQTITFASGDFGPGGSKTVSVRVVQDEIVEGGTSSVVPSFGSENFIASLTADPSDLAGRPVEDSDASTATILDRDDSEDADSSDQSKITVSTDSSLGGDDQSAEPTDIPLFDTGTWVISMTNPSSTPTAVKFQINGGADFELSDYTLSTTLGSSLMDLGGGMYSIVIPGSTTSPITHVDVVLNPTDDDVIEDDEQATLTLVEVLGGDPQVMLDTVSQSATIQVDDDDEGLLQVKSDVANGGVPIGTEGGANGKFAFLLKDKADPSLDGDSDTSTTIDFKIDFSSLGDATYGVDYTLALPVGLDPSLYNLVVNSPVGSMVTGSIDIPAGEASAELEVVVINDLDVEDTEDVTIMITGKSGNTDIFIDGTMDTATVEIEDDGDGLKVVISASDNGSEPNDQGTFTVQLLDGNGAPFILPIGSTPGNLGLIITYDVVTDVGVGFADDDDYVGLSGEVRIFEGFSTGTIFVDIEDDDLIEGDEEVTIKLKGILTFSGQDPVSDINGEFICHDTAEASLDIIDDDTDFAVTGVKVSSSEWASSFNALVDPTSSTGFQGYAIGTGADQDDTVPWVNIDQLVVTFSEAVDAAFLNPGNFILHGLQGASTPDIINVVADSSGTSVRLELSEPIINDRLTLEIVDNLVSDATGSSLNGEFTNGVSSFGSGDGVTGGDFNFTFNVLPGDTSGSTDPGLAVTSVADAGAAFTMASSGGFFGAATTWSNMFMDVNGNGFVQAADAGNVFTLAASGGFFGLTLPAVPPSGTGNLIFDSPDLSVDTGTDKSTRLTTSRFSAASSTVSDGMRLSGSVSDSSVDDPMDRFFANRDSSEEVNESKESAALDDFFGKTDLKSGRV